MSHYPHMDALLNTVETLVMLGDPDLNSSNQNEWIHLISNCLPCKTLPKHLSYSRDAKCLQNVACRFEEFTLQSTLFQVSCAAEPKRKHALRFRATDHRCICSATMTVRMWTTANEDVTVPPGEGDKKICAFYPKSPLYRRLIAIPYGAQFSISDTQAQLPVLEPQTNDSSNTCFSMGESVIDPTRNGTAAPQATFLTMHPLPLTEPIPVASEEPANAPDNTSASGIEDEASFTGPGDQHPEQDERSPDSPAAKVSTDTKILPYSVMGNNPQEGIILGLGRPESSVKDVLQENTPETISVLESPRVARRSPILSMRVPSRDARFFGREELLVPLEGILTSIFVPPRGKLANPDFGPVIVLHGAGGVGKSAIALELTYRTQAKFDHVFWLRANSYLHLAQSFHEAAVSLGLVQDRRDYNHKSSRQKLAAWLSTASSKWLLVLDDVDELQILSHFIPNRSRGSIIVTSRQPVREGLDLGEDERVQSFEVGPFVVEEATEFIRSLAPCAVDAANSAADLTTIAENCRCLPLTLRRVGTVLNHCSLSRDKRIVAALDQHAVSVLASQPSSPLLYANLSSTSHALANVITFLDPYCIDDAILLGAQRYKQVPLSAYPMNDHDYFFAKSELIAHALLFAGAAPSALGIHRVTAKSLRARLDPETFRKGFHCASRLLEARWPSRRKMKNIVLGSWPEFDTLHSHVHKLSSILVEYDRKRNEVDLERELSNDSYLELLLLSTWYNAHRGNAEEDQVLIRLAHGLIARSQRSNPMLLQTETSSTALPARLIDVGLDNTQLPRLVDTAGQTGCYVALSHCWSSRGSRGSSDTQLTMSNLSRLQRSIEPSDMRRCVFDAIELTRSLGVRYIWVESLCVVQDNHEDWLDMMSKMSDIYRSAILTITTVGTNDETVESCVDSSVLEQPFSIFLDWSRPTVAKSLSHRLFSNSALLLALGAEYIHDFFMATLIDESDTSHESILDTTQQHDAEIVEAEVETTDTRFDEAVREIDEGVHYIEAGKSFEALASFMKAKEVVIAFQPLTPRSWKIHAVASANIALVYQMQHLPAMALDIAEASLAVQSRLPEMDYSSTLELVRLRFAMGSIYNALENSNESLNCFKAASKDLERLPEGESLSESADWKGVLDLKLAEHRMRKKEYKEAHALLQQSLDHFQSQDSLSAQAHLARTLHWESVVYEAQGSKIMCNAIKAAARETWLGVREARGRALSEGFTSPNADNFDEEVEVWYR